MIEVGSYHYFVSFGHFNIAAAEAENGENIGISTDAGAQAAKALWHLKKCLEIYDDLIISVEPMTIADSARQVLSTFKWDSFHKELISSGSTIDELNQWNQLVSAARSLDPVEAIRLFVNKVRMVLPKLELISTQFNRGQMNPDELHKTITLYLNALLTGQYIAHFNRETRTRYKHLLSNTGVAATQDDDKGKSDTTD